MIPEHEFNERAADLLKRWRKTARISQKEIAQKFGVRRQTITALESGSLNLKLYTLFLYSYFTKQSLDSAFYEILGHHDKNEGLASSISDKIKSFRRDESAGLSFIFFGSHGADLRTFIHLCAMYLHLPLYDRQHIALLILNYYEIASARGSLICPDDFRPDVDLVAAAQQNGKETAQNLK